MTPAAAEPINSYLTQCVIFMAVVPVVATTVAIWVVLRIKKRAAQDAGKSGDARKDRTEER